MECFYQPSPLETMAKRIKQTELGSSEPVCDHSKNERTTFPIPNGGGVDIENEHLEPLEISSFIHIENHWSF